ncbi:MAG: hypothetical protein QXH03_00005, partial [Candidatus Bathyarchaeia archaeon]
MRCDLLLSHPFFKRRYAVATDMFVGCRIGCEFCYYRWTPFAPHFRRGASLLPLCSPRDYWNVLLESKLIRPGDIILFCARSDFSMPENRAAFSEFLEKYFDPSQKPLRFLLLQRPPWKKEDWEKFREHPVIFGTTITPCAFQKGFNSVRDDAQIRGLVELREAGCPPERISLELGPILPDTVEAAVEIARVLYLNGVLTFLVYRGSSLGPGDHRKLREKGFWTELKPYTYFDGKEEKPHEYYQLKNYIPPETEKRFLEGVEGIGLRIYRHTGHLYAKEFGARVAVTRNNRLREDMICYARPLSLGEVRAKLEEVFGIRCEIEEISPVLFRLHRMGTEDIAHA